MDEKVLLCGGWVQGRETGREKGKTSHRGPGLPWSVPESHFMCRHHRAAHGTGAWPLHCPVFSRLDGIPIGVHVSQRTPPELMGSLTVLQAVFHQVPIDAARPDPVGWPPLEGGGGICHILHCQVLWFTRGCWKDPGKGEVEVSKGSKVSREGQGSELKSPVRRGINMVGQRSMSNDVCQGSLKQGMKG